MNPISAFLMGVWQFFQSPVFILFIAIFLAWGINRHVKNKNKEGKEVML